MIKNTKAFALLLFLLLIIYGLTRTHIGCSFEEFERVESDDKVYIAKVLLSNCGATTDWGTTVAVSYQQDEEILHFSLKGKPETNQLKLTWEENGSLTISNIDFEKLMYLRKDHTIVKVNYQVSSNSTPKHL